MYGHDTLFLYYIRRAQQERIAAISAGSLAAVAAHRTLSKLHAAKASLAVTTEVSLDDRRAQALPSSHRVEVTA